MRTATLGNVIVPATIENLGDITEVRRGILAADQVRRVEVSDARVDTGATLLGMPKRLIDRLGLALVETRQATATTGTAPVNIYESVKLTVQGRDCDIRVTELADDCPVLIGYFPLELFDFVVDPKGERLIGNPDHGGEQMYDLL